MPSSEAAENRGDIKGGNPAVPGLVGQRSCQSIVATKKQAETGLVTSFNAYFCQPRKDGIKCYPDLNQAQ